MLKRSLAMFLVIAMVLAFAGCSKPAPAGNGGGNGSSSDINTGSTGYAPGIWENGVYTSKFIGMKYTLPEDYSYNTADELLAQAENDGNTPTEKQRGGDFSDALFIYEMTVKSPMEDVIMSMMILNLDMDPISKLLSEDAYLEAMGEGIVEGFGADLVDLGTIFSRDIGGKSFKILPIDLVGGQMTQWNAVRKDGSYICLMTMVIVGDAADNDEMLDRFEAL